MEGGIVQRNSWLACPNCGHRVANARTCDIEFKCKHCGFEFEVIIRASAAPAQPQQSLPPPKPREASNRF